MDDPAPDSTSAEHKPARSSEDSLLGSTYEMLDHPASGVRSLEGSEGQESEAKSSFEEIRYEGEGEGEGGEGEKDGEGEKESVDESKAEELREEHAQSTEPPAPTREIPTQDEPTHEPPHADVESLAEPHTEQPTTAEHPTEPISTPHEPVPSETAVAPASHASPLELASEPTTHAEEPKEHEAPQAESVEETSVEELKHEQGPEAEDPQQSAEHGEEKVDAVEESTREQPPAAELREPPLHEEPAPEALHTGVIETANVEEPVVEEPNVGPPTADLHEPAHVVEPVTEPPVHGEHVSEALHTTVNVEQPIVEESKVGEPAGEPVVEEPKVEEPVEEPTVEEPSVENPAVEDQTSEGPAVEEPTVEEPAVEETAVEHPAVEEPAVEEPEIEEPAIKEPEVEEPVEEPTVKDPSVEKPAVEEQTSAEPAVEEPTVEPTIEHPAVEEPEIQEPVVGEPAIKEPEVEEPVEDPFEDPKVEERVEELMEEPEIEETFEQPAVEEPEVEEPPEEPVEGPAEEPVEGLREEPEVEEPIEEPAVEEPEVEAPVEEPIEEPLEEEPEVEEPIEEPVVENLEVEEQEQEQVEEPAKELTDEPVEEPPEEPKVEEPTVAVPAIEEPTVAGEEPADELIEEPKVEEPVVEEPTTAEPKVEEPAVAEPAAEKPAVAVEEPAVESVEEPKVEEPAVEPIEEPKVEEALVEVPSVEASAALGAPVVEELKVEEPSAEEPAIEEPAVEEPALKEPDLELAKDEPAELAEKAAEPVEVTLESAAPEPKAPAAEPLDLPTEPTAHEAPVHEAPQAEAVAEANVDELKHEQAAAVEKTDEPVHEEATVHEEPVPAEAEIELAGAAAEEKPAVEPAVEESTVEEPTVEEAAVEEPKVEPFETVETVTEPVETVPVPIETSEALQPEPAVEVPIEKAEHDEPPHEPPPAEPVEVSHVEELEEDPSPTESTIEPTDTTATILSDAEQPALAVAGVIAAGGVLAAAEEVAQEEAQPAQPIPAADVTHHPLPEETQTATVPLAHPVLDEPVTVVESHPLGEEVNHAIVAPHEEDPVPVPPEEFHVLEVISHETAVVVMPEHQPDVQETEEKTADEEAEPADLSVFPEPSEPLVTASQAEAIAFLLPEDKAEPAEAVEHHVPEEAAQAVDEPSDIADIETTATAEPLPEPKDDVPVAQETVPESAAAHPETPSQAEAEFEHAPNDVSNIVATAIGEDDPAPEHSTGTLAELLVAAAPPGVALEESGGVVEPTIEASAGTDEDIPPPTVSNPELDAEPEPSSIPTPAEDVPLDTLEAVPVEPAVEEEADLSADQRAESLPVETKLDEPSVAPEHQIQIDDIPTPEVIEEPSAADAPPVAFADSMEYAPNEVSTIVANAIVQDEATPESTGTLAEALLAAAPLAAVPDKVPAEEKEEPAADALTDIPTSAIGTALPTEWDSQDMLSSTALTEPITASEERHDSDEQSFPSEEVLEKEIVPPNVPSELTEPMTITEEQASNAPVFVSAEEVSTETDLSTASDPAPLSSEPAVPDASTILLADEPAVPAVQDALTEPTTTLEEAAPLATAATVTALSAAALMDAVSTEAPTVPKDLSDEQPAPEHVGEPCASEDKVGEGVRDPKSEEPAPASTQPASDVTFDTLRAPLADVDVQSTVSEDSAASIPPSSPRSDMESVADVPFPKPVTAADLATLDQQIPGIWGRHLRRHDTASVSEISVVPEPSSSPAPELSISPTVEQREDSLGSSAFSDIPEIVATTPTPTSEDTEFPLLAMETPRRTTLPMKDISPQHHALSDTYETPEPIPDMDETTAPLSDSVPPGISLTIPNLAARQAGVREEDEVSESAETSISDSSHVPVVPSTPVQDITPVQTPTVEERTFHFATPSHARSPLSSEVVPEALTASLVASIGDADIKVSDLNTASEDAATEPASASADTVPVPNTAAAAKEAPEAPSIPVIVEPHASQPPEIPELVVPVEPATTGKPVVLESEINEWYLKEIHWSPTGNSADSKPLRIITQERNGSCSLIALCNVLIMKGDIEILPPNRNSVSYDYLSSLLATYLLTNKESSSLGSALSALPRTRYGLEVNPDFTDVHRFKPRPRSDGEEGGELALFSLAGVPLLHGWLVDPSSPLHDPVSRRGDYDSAQQVIAAADHLTNGLLLSESENMDFDTLNNPAWNADQRRTVKDALAVQQFLNSASQQLTYHGLFSISSALKANDLAVLFRNSHLSVIYKRPPPNAGEEAALYTLVTDSAFVSEPAVVWETLRDIDGASDFVDSDFHAASAIGGDWAGQVVQADHSEHEDGFYDNDLALAQQLQAEENQRVDRQPSQQSARSAAPSTLSVNVPKRARNVSTTSAMTMHPPGAWLTHSPPLPQRYESRDSAEGEFLPRDDSSSRSLRKHDQDSDARRQEDKKSRCVIM